MRKRLVRKAFDMIQDLAESENKEVGSNKLSIFIFSIWIYSLYGLKEWFHVIPGLQKILGELW